MEKKNRILIAVLVLLMIICGLMSTIFYSKYSKKKIKNLHVDIGRVGIGFIEGPFKSLGGDMKILVSVENNTSEVVRGCRAILIIFNEQKERIFEHTNAVTWVSENIFSEIISGKRFFLDFISESAEPMKWDGVIKPQEEVRLNFYFAGRLSFYPNKQIDLSTKEFKQKYGEAKYFVVELYKGNKLIDTMSKPDGFIPPDSRTKSIK